MPIQIGVIGAGGKISEDVKTQAEDVGRFIAQKSGVLFCGGLGSVMEYAAKGAKMNNGLTIGILPTEEKKANEYIDILIPTDLGYSRNTTVILASDAVIAINGSTGTLSEIAMAMNYKIPVIVLKGSGGVADLFSELHAGDEYQMPWPKDKIQIANNPEEAVNMAIKSIKRKIE
ncbi:MAG: TIGR00725 family protein [Candidatus Sifarchaeia archaeon]